MSQSVLIEVVEHSPCWDGPRFVRALDRLRAVRVRIALDDAGLGHSNRRMILDCRPDCFKIDPYFVTNVHRDPHPEAVIESVSQLARKLGAHLVAEGGETAQDLAALTGMGVELVQGHLFSPALPERESVRRMHEACGQGRWPMADGAPGSAQAQGVEP